MMQIKKSAFVIVTYKPDTKKELLDFASTFTHYDVYVIVDDNSHDYKELKETYKTISFIQVENETCSKSGMKNTSTMTLKKDVTGWDKALYWFAFINTNYEYIWFSEDDVFFYNEQTLINIDTKYQIEDLLCNSSFDEGKLNEWLWKYIQISFPPPYYCGMMCICRMSQNMIKCLKDYAVKHNTVFFLEALFPSIAKKNNLMCVHSPEEFDTVTWQHQHDLSIFCIDKLYHPMKIMDDHIKIRNNLKQKIKQKEKNKKQKERQKHKNKKQKKGEQTCVTEKNELQNVIKKEEILNIDYENEYEII
jgi:hypothetical protein